MLSPNLADVVRQNAANPYTWDPRVKRYRDRAGGRFVSEKAIIALTEGRIERAKDELKELGSRLASGRINLDTFQVEMANQLKTLHLQQYILGRGGLKNMSDSDYLTVARRLKDEYSYLRKFAKDLRSGSQSEAQLKHRIELYAAHSKVSYLEAQQAVEKDAGSRFMRRLLGNCNPHCQDCLRYASQGWQPLGSLPLPGLKCQCGANCCCEVKYKTDE